VTAPKTRRAGKVAQFPCPDCGRIRTATGPEVRCRACQKIRPDRVCKVEGCHRKHYGRGLCALHWCRWNRNGDPLVIRSKLAMPLMSDRFWAKIERRGSDECWLWTGSFFPSGYGAFKSEKMTTAHRTAYELLVGPIPSGLHIDHLCCNRACVNPKHLEPVTAGENNHRAALRRRASA